jgi:hypothetical protein
VSCLRGVGAARVARGGGHHRCPPRAHRRGRAALTHIAQRSTQCVWRVVNRRPRLAGVTPIKGEIPIRQPIVPDPFLDYASTGQCYLSRFVEARCLPPTPLIRDARMVQISRAKAVEVLQVTCTPCLELGSRGRKACRPSPARGRRGGAARARGRVQRNIRSAASETNLTEVDPAAGRRATDAPPSRIYASPRQKAQSCKGEF